MICIQNYRWMFNLIDSKMEVINMTTYINANINVMMQCPICVGTGRLYPLSLTGNLTSYSSNREENRGFDCPNCDGLGTIVM